jgi:hypothetical protein
MKERSSMSAEPRPELRLRVEQNVHDLLHERATQAGITGPPNRRASELVRRHIYELLGLGEPPDPMKVAGQKRAGQNDYRQRQCALTECTSPRMDGSTMCEPHDRKHKRSQKRSAPRAHARR